MYIPFTKHRELVARRSRATQRVFNKLRSQSDGYGHGHHKAGGTACLVKGSYCNCHYCKCDKGTVHCGGYGKGGYGKKYCYGSTQGEYCHCDYCKCKHGYGSSGYGHCDDHHHHHHHKK